jgi:DUF4097 and DUF4098 domain-containing protein YvlB
MAGSRRRRRPRRASRHAAIRVSRLSGPIGLETGHGGIRVEECGGPLEAQTSSGDITMGRINGPVRARTGHGGIQVSAVGEAELHASAGDVRAAGVSGALAAQTGHGSLRVESCSGAVKAETRSGSIEIHQARGDVEAATGHGSLTIELAGDRSAPRVALSTNSGEIDLTMPASISARLAADCASGQIESPSFPDAHTTPRRNHLEALLGGGEGEIRLRSGHGSIRVQLSGSE